MNIVLYALTYLFYRELNRRRDMTWKSLSVQVCIVKVFDRLLQHAEGALWFRNNKSTLKPPKMWGTRGLISGLLTNVDIVCGKEMSRVWRDPRATHM